MVAASGAPLATQTRAMFRASSAQPRQKKPLWRPVCTAAGHPSRQVSCPSVATRASPRPIGKTRLPHERRQLQRPAQALGDHVGAGRRHAALDHPRGHVAGHVVVAERAASSKCGAGASRASGRSGWCPCVALQACRATATRCRRTRSPRPTRPAATADDHDTLETTALRQVAHQRIRTLDHGRGWRRSAARQCGGRSDHQPAGSHRVGPSPTGGRSEAARLGPHSWRRCACSLDANSVFADPSRSRRRTWPHLGPKAPIRPASTAPTRSRAGTR